MLIGCSIKLIKLSDVVKPFMIDIHIRDIVMESNKSFELKDYMQSHR